MKINAPLFIAVVLACSPAFAADFASRVAEAKQASATSDGARYDAALGPHIGTAMQSCIPPGSADPTNLGAFTLVGYVTATGALNSIAIEPRTKVSSCFAERFGKSMLPKPPNLGHGGDYPVVVEMQVAP